MLWYLHLCSTADMVVMSYVDHPIGTMTETADGGGYFAAVTLQPEIVLASGDLALAEQLHEQAHELCFIANSVNFPVRCVPVISMQNNGP
jgi:organic hydroperoxide reductase OsmC/OhrA